MKIPWIRTGMALALLTAAAVAQQIPEVSITAQGFPAKTSEPCPLCRVVPLTMTLSRTGDLTHSLNVHLDTAGTATSGVDYVPVATPVEIPAGQATVNFQVVALDDHLAEGPEVVEVRVLDAAIYNAGTPSNAMGVIGDDEADAPAERLDLTSPKHGTVFPSGVSSIRLEALGVSVTREIDMPVEFLANGVVIGQSNPPVFDRMPVPCLPRVHDFEWSAPADGTYTLTARVPAIPGAANAALVAPPVQIRVGEGEEPAVVSIRATSRVAEEDSAPTLRPLRYHGVFTISRTGGTANSQPFYLLVSGTATPEIDYKALPFAGSIPAGESSTTVIVEAVPDNLAEPLETVIAEVSGCPPDGFGAPCFLLNVDPAHQRDTVLIRDDGITTASLEMTAPLAGAQFPAGEPVVMDVTALDVSGGITRVDFYAGNAKIGTSELFFFVPPPPAEPVYHTFTWQGAPAGTHVLSARAESLNGVPVTSPPVTITVGGNRSPAVVMTSPGDGAQIPEGQPVHLTVEATDPDGYTDTAEFYANGHKLGEVVLNFLVPPPPGETQTFDFGWHGAPPGTHVLMARVRDDRGAWGTSAPVTIVITPENSLPVITVHARDAFAVEPAPGLPANTASFLLRRHGSTAGPLGVNYTMHGTAANGTDYTALNGFASFAAGEGSTVVMLTPLADNLVEHREVAVLQLELQFDDGPERYRLGLRRRAIAVIADRSWLIQHPAQDVCSPLGDGHFHLCFPAAAGFAPAWRIEATDDFRQWETVHEGAAADEELHFVDPDTPELSRRFYRLAPDANAAGP